MSLPQAGYAFGDWMLEIFIGCMLLVPTFLLALVIRNSEHLYTIYSKILFGLSLTAPTCLALFSIPFVNQGAMFLGEIYTARLSGSPIVVVGLGLSRLLARFDRAKRWTSYTLLIEILTLGLMLALLLLPGKAHGG